MTTDSSWIEDLPDVADLPLPFSWRDLPRRPCESGGYAAISVDARWTTVLADGREVWLTALHQYPTYDGVVCGFPETDEVRAWPIEGAVRMADQLFQCEPSRIAILPPELMLSTVVRERGGKREEVTVEFLPAVCSIGTFESKTPASDPDSDGSEVVAVWFQGAFGPPQPGHVTRCIQAIDWDEFASDLHVWLNEGVP
jgi:hypothetical protein